MVPLLRCFTSFNHGDFRRYKVSHTHTYIYIYLYIYIYVYIYIYIWCRYFMSNLLQAETFCPGCWHLDVENGLSMGIAIEIRSTICFYGTCFIANLVYWRYVADFEAEWCFFKFSWLFRKHPGANKRGRFKDMKPELALDPHPFSSCFVL